LEPPGFIHGEQSVFKTRAGMRRYRILSKLNSLGRKEKSSEKKLRMIELRKRMIKKTFNEKFVFFICTLRQSCKCYEEII
jgi:hypothetical protein